LPFRFIDEPTYRRYDMPGSVSNSPAFRRGMVNALLRILELDLPGTARQGLERKLASAVHDLSEMALQAGEMKEAWRQHLRTLGCSGGMRYLGFTRHLIAGSLRRPAGV
jgi:hypothetical protein